MQGFIIGMLALLLAACSATPRPASAPPPPSASAETQQPAPAVGLRNVEPAKAEAPKPPPEAPKAAPRSAPAAPAAGPKAPAPPPGTPPAAPKTASPPAVARAAPAPAPLDLKSLEQRLKDSSAIGVLTKLSLKNQEDDLVDRFRLFHAGTRPPTLAELRPSFELLFMKVLSLLQDKDPSLAHDINVSREAIWGVLADRQKFAQHS